MRTTALPSIMDVVARNYNARAAECAVFEDATVYLPQGGPEELPREVETVVMAAYGPTWDYLALKGVVEACLLYTSCPSALRWPSLRPFCPKSARAALPLRRRWRLWQSARLPWP